MDFHALLLWMKERYDIAHLEHKEEVVCCRVAEAAARAEREEQQREEAAQSKALVTRLAGLHNLHTSSPGEQTGITMGSVPPGPTAALSVPTAAVQPSTSFSIKVTYQTFKEWRQT